MRTLAALTREADDLIERLREMANELDDLTAVTGLGHDDAYDLECDADSLRKAANAAQIAINNVGQLAG